MALSLIVSHNIFLTREQSYKLVDGNALEVVGVNVPVWIYKNKISEPAVEVFSKYKIGTEANKLSIKEKGKIYEINIPKSQTSTPEGIVSLRDLLDIKDRGGEWLAFKQYHTVKQGKKTINVIHFVEIKRMEDLTQTLS